MNAVAEPRWDAPFAEVAAYWNTRPLCQELDIRLEALERGAARLAVRRSARNMGGVQNSLNGGVLAAVAELAAHLALRTLLEPGARIERTRDFGISYVSPAVASRTVAEARVLRMGRTSVAVIEISDGDDAHVNCAARVSCIVGAAGGK